MFAEVWTRPLKSDSRGCVQLMTKDEQIGIRVPSEIKKLLSKIAEQEGRSLAQICEIFLRGGLDAYKKEGTKYIQRILATKDVGHA